MRIKVVRIKVVRRSRVQSQIRSRNRPHQAPGLEVVPSRHVHSTYAGAEVDVMKCSAELICSPE